MTTEYRIIWKNLNGKINRNTIWYDNKDQMDRMLMSIVLGGGFIVRVEERSKP